MYCLRFALTLQRNYNIRNIKTVKYILTTIVGIVMVVAAMLIVLPHVGAVQTFLGTKVADALAEKLNTEVSIGKIQLGLPNTAVVDDVVLLDQQDKSLLQASRLAAKIELMPLIREGKIVIDNVELYDTSVNIYRDTREEPFNFQFVIDAFQSTDTTHTPLDLAIRRVKIKNSNVAFRDVDFDVSAHKFNALMALEHLTDDSLHAKVDGFTLEANSKKLGIKSKTIENLSAEMLYAMQSGALSVTDFTLKLPASTLNVGSANYNTKSGKYDIHVGKSHLSTTDFEEFVPVIKGIDKGLTLVADVSGAGTDFKIDAVKIDSDDGGVQLDARGNEINALKVDKETIDFVLKRLLKKEVKAISNLGDIAYSGFLNPNPDNILFDGNLRTSIGNAKLNGSVTGRKFDVSMITDGLDLKKLTGENDFGMLVADVSASGNTDFTALDMTGLVKSVQYKSAVYKNLNLKGKLANGMVDGTLALDNPNCKADIALQSTLGEVTKSVKATGHLAHVNPNAMGLIKDFANTFFDADVDADLSGSTIDNLIGSVDIRNFSMKSAENTTVVNHLNVLATNVDGSREVILNSDFAEADIKGQFALSSLMDDIVFAVKSRLPSIPGLPNINDNSKNRYSFDFSLKSMDVLSKFVSIPLELSQPLNVNGMVDDYAGKMNIDVFMPRFKYDESEYKDGEVMISTPGDKLICNVFVTKIIENGEHYNIKVDAEAADNKLDTKVSWDNPFSTMFSGTIDAETKFFRDKSGMAAAKVGLLKSEVVFNDTVWNVMPSVVEWADKQIAVQDFVLYHGDQYLKIEGVASENDNDSLIVDLKGVNVEYILNAVKFRSVKFAGYASGRASLKSVLGTPDAHADLVVNNFKFQGGKLGVLDAKVVWNQEEQQIDIDAFTHDEQDGTIKIDGFVSPTRNCIDLGLEPRNVNLEFLQSFIGGIMDSTVGRGSGHLRVVGPLSTIQLVGAMSPNARLRVHPLHTDYEVRGDSIYFVPDDILFKNVKAYDRDGNVAYVSGGVHHKHLTRLTFDLGIKTDKLLAYETKTFGDDTFYGTVYARGDVTMRGISGQVNISGDVTPLQGSTFTYNAVVQNYLNTQNFITFRDKSKRNQSGRFPQLKQITVEEDKDIRTNLYCDFNINLTPDAQIRVLMDSKSNDYITLYGNGVLKANYYNKGKFGLYGLYNVTNGNYGVTIQDVIHKDFAFQDGGTIQFVGDPYDAVMNLQASYMVSGVSLSDLAIGNSFTNNTIRVNCLMNITGTPFAPIVNFDLDMPTVNSDEKQMIRSLIDSEEDMNQQVVYLLGIGRFYSKTTNNAMQVESNRDQTSLAMQSLLSGTLSSQLNNMLGQFMNNKNWNIGANIYTGDEGWNNAQYEGTVSGRMLNNRLLFNGQFGYRDNVKTANTSFIGDFELQYLLLPSGNLSVRAYNQANERYFTKTSLNTQGIGLLMKKDFSGIKDLFTRRRSSNKNK